MTRDRLTGVVGARPAARAKRNLEPLISPPTGLTHGVWPGWEKCRQWGLVGRVNAGAVLAAVRAARDAEKGRRPLDPVHVGHLLAELDRCASAYYGERDGNTLLKDELAKRATR